MKTLLQSFQVITVVCAVLTLIAIWFYTVSNDSGHTAVDPSVASGPFIAVLIVGGATAFIRLAHRGLALALLVLGVAGLVLGPFMTSNGILIQYDDWARSGMPDRNPQTDPLLSSFMTAAFVLAALVAIRGRKKFNPE